MARYLPLFLLVFSNSLYQICSKSSPKNMDPLASLTVSYFVAFCISILLYFLTHRGESLLKEYANLNWTAFAIGVLVLGIDIGNRYMYRAGWSANTVCIVSNVMITVVMLFVGRLLYHESITWKKIVGALLCFGGTYLVIQ